MAIDHVAIIKTIDTLILKAQKLKQIVKFHQRARVILNETEITFTADQKSAVLTEYAKLKSQLAKEFQNLPDIPKG